MSDGVYSEKKSLIAVLLTLQKLEPEVYTDTMITAFCSVRDSFVRSINFTRNSTGTDYRDDGPLSLTTVNGSFFEEPIWSWSRDDVDHSRMGDVAAAEQSRYTRKGTS